MRLNRLRVFRFDFLEINAEDEQLVTADTANQLVVTGINPNESNLLIDNPLDNQVNHQNPIFEASAEQVIPVVEFTEMEK